MSKRNRGAQPGNTNAIRHGFYSKLFRETESEDLEALKLQDLTSEIYLMRVLIRRAFTVCSPENTPDVLQLVGIASVRLAHLLRTQELLGGSESDGIAEAISQAISEVMVEMNIHL